MATDWKDTYQIIDEDTLRLAENAPMIAPEATPTRDETRDSNNLLGKTFQFSYQWLYKDYRQSILSPYSYLVVSDELTNDILTYDSTLNNKITIKCPQGNSEVIGVNVLAREGNSGSWFYCNKYVKSKHEDGVLAVFDFYDDSVREYVDLTSALATYHNVPLDAKNVEIVDNKVVLSQCTTGYPSPEVNYELLVESGPNTQEQAVVVNAVISTVSHSNSMSLQITFDIPNVEKGDTVVFNIRWKADLVYSDIPTITWPWSNSYQEKHRYELVYSRTYYVTKNMNAGEFQEIAYDYMINGLSFTREISLMVVWNGHWEGVAGIDEYPFKITKIAGPYFGLEFTSELTGKPLSGTPPAEALWFAPSGSGKITIAASQGFQSTFKKYSSYNVGIAYYDTVGRTSGVLTAKNKSIYIPGLTIGNPVVYDDSPSYIRCNILSSPPSWARYYRICVSESISFVDTYSTHSNSNCHEIEQDGRTVLALDIYTKNYSFLQGDLLVKETTTGLVKKPILGTRAIVTIEDPDDPTKTIEKAGNFIVVPKESSTVIIDNTTDGNYSQCKLAIHRHKSNQEEAVYFEDMFTGTVVDGAHSNTSILLRCGDAWIKSRVYDYTPDQNKSPYSFTGEEFDINTEMGIRGYSKGRPIVSLKDFGQKTQPITMWGGNYFRDTKTNEISAFNFEDTMMLDAQHGPINNMWLVGDVMKFLQTRKETSVYVGKSTFTDAGGNVSLAQVNSLFGNKNESPTDYGLNFKKGCAKSERLMFYWDQDKGAVVQSSPNGLLEISRYGMQSYFRDKKREIDSVLSDPTAFDVVFGYNTHTSELIALFRVNSSIDGVVFDPERNMWMQIMDLSKTISNVLYHPDVFMTLGASMSSTVGGLLYQHDPTDAQAGENNRIYDETKPLIITGVLNDAPLVEKELKSMSLDFDGLAYVEATTPVSSTSTKGQYTYVNPTSFITKSGRRHSAFLRNVRVANGNDSTLLLSGSRMKGRHAEISVRSNQPSGFEFRDMQVNWLAV